MKNYYKVLGVSENATISQITDAYKILAPQHHPDNNKNDAYAQERFIDLSVAYKTLTNSEVRKDYDRILYSVLDPNSIYSSQNNKSRNLNNNINAKGNKAILLMPLLITVVGLLFFIATASIYIYRMDVFNKKIASMGNTADRNAIYQQEVKGSVLNVAPTNVTDISATNNNNRKINLPVTINNSTKANKGDIPPNKVAANNKAADKKKIDKKDSEKKNITPATSKGFKISSSKADVLKIQGTPKSIVRYAKDDLEVWNYGKSKIVFSNGAVISYRDLDNNLKVNLE